jgi:excisionase family DNA binding protein
MTTERAAKRLQVGLATIYRMLLDGRLHGRRLGAGATRIPRAEVDALLEGRQYRPEGERPAWGDPGYPLAR